MVANTPLPWTYITGIEIERNADKTIKHITANGKEIDINKIYTFAANSFLYGSNYLNQPVCFDIKVWKTKESEAVIDFIKKNTPISLNNRETGSYYEYKK